MANKTVYPYGTGGSLPASVGIINDCITGGADKALAAQQGVVLKGLIDNAVPDVLTPISMSIGNTIPAVITASGKWSANNENHLSVIVQVSPGQKYRLVANATNNSYYAFFASYSTPSKDAVPNYPSGENNRHEVIHGQTVDFTIPAGCYYLYICIKNANTNQEPQSLSLVQGAFESEDSKMQELSGEIDELRGNIDEQVIYSELSVSSVGDSITIEKTGTDNILVKNNSKTSNNFALIALPDTLVEGKKYMVSFMYKASFKGADNWFLAVCTSSYLPTTGGINLSNTTGYDYVYASFNYTYRSGDVYLRLNSYAIDGRGYVVIKDFSISENKTDVSSLASRVNNLEDGIDDFAGYAYYGEKIKLNPSQKYRLETSASNGATGQSAAIYDRYLFIVRNKFESVVLYDMGAKSQIYTWDSGQSIDTWHCNQSSFGTAKYDDDDMFPVLYVSMRPDSGTTRCVVNVYRILPTLTGDAITSFSMTLVQKISLPAMTEQNGLGLANATIDTENGWMWTYSRNTTNGQSTSGLATFTCFAIPAMFDGGGNAIAAVTLEDSDIKDSFMDKWSIYDNQGAFIRNGKLYMMRGVPNSDSICECNVIDLYFQRKRVSRVDLYENGTRVEPEGCFYYDNTVCFTVNGSGIYRIVFN